MTEFETASLAVQHAILELSYWQSWAAFLQVGAALLVGLVQCGLLAWGISVMQESNKSRDATLTTLGDQSQALRDQGQALRDQGQVLADIGEALRDQSQALADIGAGIQELLRERRTP